MKHTKIIASLLISGIVLSGCGSSSNNDKNTTSETNTTTEANSTTETNSSVAIIESTTVTTTSGKKIKVNRTAKGFIFEGQKGKVVLLEVYGDTCPHCVDAIPSYNAIKNKYPDNVYIIALESFGTLTNASKQKYDTVAKENTGKMFSFIKKLKGYNLQSVPYLMILSKDGNIAYDKILANFPKDEIDNKIQELL